MAIYHCSIKNISRSDGKSAVASASYRAGEKLLDAELGKYFDYSSKDNVVHSEIILCENAPKEYQNREKLWNEVQKAEKAKDSRLAREWEVAIPNELSLDEAKELTNGFAQTLADEGMCVDYSIHWKEGNHHAHIMGTTRAILESGEWAPKSRKVYDLDENGQKIPLIDKKTGEQKIDKQNRKQWKNHKDDYTDWNKTEKIEEWRGRWAEQCNRYLEKEQQIDHRSYKRQGIEQIPTIHEGYVARQMERKGELSELCQINREIAIENTERVRIGDKIKKLEIDLKQAQNALYEAVKNDYLWIKTKYRKSTKLEKEIEENDEWIFDLKLQRQEYGIFEKIPDLLRENLECAYADRRQYNTEKKSLFRKVAQYFETKIEGFSDVKKMYETTKNTLDKFAIRFRKPSSEEIDNPRIKEPVVYEHGNHYYAPEKEYKEPEKMIYREPEPEQTKEKTIIKETKPKVKTTSDKGKFVQKSKNMDIYLKDGKYSLYKGDKVKITGSLEECKRKASVLAREGR